MKCHDTVDIDMMEIMSCFFQLATGLVIMTKILSSELRDHVVSTAALLLDSTSSKDNNAASSLTEYSHLLSTTVSVMSTLTET